MEEESNSSFHKQHYETSHCSTVDVADSEQVSNDVIGVEEVKYGVAGTSSKCQSKDESHLGEA